MSAAKVPHPSRQEAEATISDTPVETLTFWLTQDAAASLLHSPRLAGGWRRARQVATQGAGAALTIGEAPFQADEPPTEPPFTAKLVQKTAVFETGSPCRIALELDRGTLAAGEAQCDIRTLRLSLLAGASSGLWEMAHLLLSEYQIIPFADVRQELGKRLASGLERAPLKLTPIPLFPDESPGEVFQRLAAHGLRCWQINLRGALQYGDPEFFHQLRVSLRRLGTLLKLFKPILPAKFFAAWKDELKEIARLSEDIRDLDVMIESILQPMLASEDKATREAAERAINGCQQARGEALEVFLGKLHGPSLFAFARDLRRLKSATGKKSRLPIARFAEERVNKLHRRAVERLDITRKGVTAENSHSLRISLKHLRYAVEFFAYLFDEKGMQKYSKHVSSLQDELGAAHDLHVAIDRLRGLAGKHLGMRGIAELAGNWHGGARLPPLKQVVGRVEDQLTVCLPWCGECQRRHGGKYHRQGT